MLRLLMLAGLAALILCPAEADAKCKNAHCRFYEVELAPNYGYGPYKSDSHPDAKFEYEQELLASSGRLYVQRFYQLADLGSAAGTMPPNTYPFIPQAQAYTRNYEIAFRKRAKKQKKHWKKGQLYGRAMDVLYEYKLAGELPVVRVGIRPLNFDYRAGVDFGRYLNIPLPVTPYNPQNSRVVRAKVDYTVKLPDMAGVQAGELRYSDWQFCASCTSRFLANSKLPIYPKLDLKAQYEASGSFTHERYWPMDYVSHYQWMRSSSLSASTKLYSGDDALAAANNFFEAERLAEEKRKAEAARKAQLAEMYRDERKAYDDYVAELKAGSLRAAAYKRCGDLELRNPPNPRARGSHSGWFEDNAKYNVREYEKHVSCILNTVDTFDYSKRAAALEVAQTRLPELFAMGNFEERKIATFETTRKEVDRQQRYLKAQEERYRKLERDFDRAWEGMMRVYAERREKRISEEVSRCLAGLAMTNSLTSNSRAYCRSMAEKGYTGLSAAAAGYNGGGNRSGSSSNTASYNKPLVPEFDLGGMIANAQAVADGADSSLLWNEDGTVKTTVAQEAIDFQQQQARERERERQRVAASQQASTAPTATASSTSTTASVDPRIAQAGKTADEATQSGGAAEASTAGSNNAAGNGISITVNTTSPTAAQMRDLENGGDGRVGSTTTAQSSSDSTSSGGRTSAGGNTSVAPRTETPKPRRDTKFIWVGDLSLDRKAWPSSSRERADHDFRNTLARNRLNDFCRENYTGGDGYKGIVEVEIFHLEKRPGHVWHGKATIEGYCRVAAHHESYPEIRWCISESAGQPDCAVSKRY